MSTIAEATPTQIRWHEARRERLERMQGHQRRLPRASSPVAFEETPDDPPPAEGAVVEIPATRWKAIIYEVAAKHGVSVIEMLSDQRRKEFVNARREVFYRLSTETTLSLPAIGKRMNRDHTTVLYGIRTYKKIMGMT